MMIDRKKNELNYIGRKGTFKYYVSKEVGGYGNVNFADLWYYL